MGTCSLSDGVPRANYVAKFVVFIRVGAFAWGMGVGDVTLS